MCPNTAGGLHWDLSIQNGFTGARTTANQTRSFLLNRSKHVYLLIAFKRPEGFTQNLKSIFLVQGSAIWGSREIDFHAFVIGTHQTPFQ